ncbi:MAG: DUF484 family protein [Dongiaceae bacterium]
MGNESFDLEGKTSLKPEDVLRFLRSNPNFLIKHPEALALLSPPSLHEEKGGKNSIVDLHAFMLKRLQSQVSKLKETQNELLTATRDNMGLQQRIHQAVLVMLSARSFEEFVEIVTQELNVHLQVDAIALCIEAPDFEQETGPLFGIQVIEPGLSDEILGARDVVFRPEIVGDPALFGGMAPLIQSDAIVRLQISPMTPPGLLVLGSRQVNAFHGALSAELLLFFAEAIERQITTWLQLPR